MTDNEIIKALECCSTYKGKCTDCPAFVKVDRSNCKQVLVGALNIINCQKAEIEKLCIEIDGLIIAKDLLFDEAEALIKKAKAEAIKGVTAEIYNSFAQYETYDRLHTFEILDRINSVEEFLLNNLVKERVGDNEVQWSGKGKCPITPEQFNAIYEDEGSEDDESTKNS